VVVCPLHGHTFELCSGAETAGGELAVRSYPVAVSDGTIRIKVRPA
jgi:nitrite reductase (NADH) small subunit